MTEEEKKVVLITGGSRGIGLTTAQFLSEEGYEVVAAARHISDELRSLHPNITFIQLDVTKFHDIEQAVQKILKEKGSIDVLINNAGIALGGPIEEASQEDMQKVFDVNFYGAVFCTQSVLPSMRKNRTGHIINISSIQGIVGTPYAGIYCASKMALEGLTESLFFELKPFNIHVSLIEPGFTNTKNKEVLPGTRVIPDSDDYQENKKKFFALLDQQNDDSEETLQPAEEVSDVIHQALKNPADAFRIQTSQAAKDFVSTKLGDLDGLATLSDISTLFHDLGIHFEADS